MLAAIVSVGGLSLSDEEKYWLEKNNPAGVSLFGRNIDNLSQIKALTEEIYAAVGRDDVIIAIDQEGGRVRRLNGNDFHKVASAYVLGQLDEDMSAIHAKIISNDMKRAGINLNYAPVLDVAYPSTHEMLKSRCLGNNERKIALLGKKMISTYEDNGICPCMKHMPGHGQAKTDPHLALPVINSDLALLAKDFYPFIENNTCPTGMTAHIVFSAVDDKLPMTFSKKAIDYLIRGIIGFEGILISDSIEMGALSGSLDERISMALDAGCDLICYCRGKIEDLEIISKNCPQVTETQKEQIQKIFNIFQKQPQPLNSSELDRYYHAIGLVEEYDEKYDATTILQRMS